MAMHNHQPFVKPYSVFMRVCAWAWSAATELPPLDQVGEVKKLRAKAKG
jgi:hypothetical protein